MGAQETFPLYDRILDGRLGEMLADWRGEDPRPSWAEISYRLRDHDIIVTAETVRRWAARLGLDGEAGAA